MPNYGYHQRASEVITQFVLRTVRAGCGRLARRGNRLHFFFQHLQRVTNKPTGWMDGT